MIVIENLTKRYKSKNKKICTALDCVNLTLPECGMVFIIGKSGSGKSTLLNMIGGLDSFDEGRIISHGNDLSAFRGSDFYKYRATYAGFVFQDYHLIDELTVGENIALEAQIAGVADADVEAALESVDLQGYGQRFPDELSGGQKQRVAIARALIKSPKVLLCDEPTGNLDKRTSTQIMDMLREISKERLVIVVSHNMPDAEKYADRIIELADGKIIGDLTRRVNYSNEITINDGVLSLPYNHNLTPQESGEISRAILDGRVREVRQNDGGYERTPVLSAGEGKTDLVSSRLKFKSVMKLFCAFSKNGKGRSATTAFVCAAMVVLLIIFQSFLMFDSSAAVADSVAGTPGGTIVLKKDTYVDEYGAVVTSKLYKVTDEDLASITNISGEQTRKYLLYNYSTVVDVNNLPWNVELENQYTYNFGTKHIYSPQMAGTLVCDEEYLQRKFGKDATLTVLAGDIYDSQYGSGVIITDYLADGMMVYNPLVYKSYEDVLGNQLDRCYITAVIDTGYKDRYKELIDEVKSNNDLTSSGINGIDKQRVIELLDDIKNNLSIAYSVNPDFHNAAVSEDTKYYSRVAGFSMNLMGKERYIEKGDAVRDTSGRLGVGEILLSNRILKEIFPDKSTEEFTFPMQITMTRYEYPDNSGAKLAEFTFSVVGTSTDSSVFCEEDYRKIKAIDIIPFAVYVEQYDNISSVIDCMSDRYYSWSSTEGQAVKLLNKSVNMFFDLFRLIEVLTLITAVVFLVSYSIRSVRKNHYQIGVIKAIGGRSSDISLIFVMQNLILSAAISVITLIGSAILLEVANDILVSSFMQITDVGISSIRIISFDFAIVGAAIGISVLLNLVFTAVPLLLLHNVKPIDIIKAKE